MKTKFYFVLIFVLLCNFVSAQDAGRKVPSVEIKNLSGKSINTSTLKNDSGLIIIDFFALWCKPCVLALDNINEVYKNWQAETGVKIIAISVDDARSTSKVAGFANGRGWGFDIYLDANSDFKRAMNVNNIPHTFLIKNGQIVWQHNSYSPGDEDELYELIKKETALLKNN